MFPSPRSSPFRSVLAGASLALVALAACGRAPSSKPPGPDAVSDPEIQPHPGTSVVLFLVDTLRAEGLERIEAQGKPFDPELHEALMQSGEGDGDPVVADVLRPGYTLKGRVLRPAGVRVERQ